MIFFPEPKKCPTCDKRLRKGHVCKEDPSKKTDFKCKFCEAYLDNEVSLGFHLWKHTKDAKYIVTTPTKKCDKTPEKISAKAQWEESFFPKASVAIVILFWLKWAGYLAVAGLNLLAQLSDRISPYGV